MNKRKILLIGILPPPINGQALAFQSLMNEMNVETLIFSGKRKSNTLIKIVKVVNFLGLLFRLFFRLIFHKYVVYHTISQSKEGFFRDFLIVYISKILGSKVVVHIHGGNYDGFYTTQKPFIQKRIISMLSMTNSIIVLSKGLTKMFDFAPDLFSKIKIIQNGLLWNVEENQPGIKTLPTDSNSTIKIIFLSNLIESKGYLAVLEATSLLVNEYGYNVKTDFCGEFIQYKDAQKFVKISDAERYFYDFIDKNHLRNHVEYHGIIDIEKKKELLKEVHFFVLPTNYINEGQPISIIEAFASSSVVLTTDFRGISDMISNHQSGIFIKFNDPKEIAFEIHNLIQCPNEYQRISSNSYRNYQENFTKETHLKKLISEIESHTFLATNAIDFHSETALEFEEKYDKSPQFQQRFEVWTTLFNQFIKPEMKVLDAGCGSGIFSIYLARKKCIVKGIDGSEKMIELCKKNNQLENLDVSFQQANLPFDDVINFEKQDVILCSSVLEYIVDYETVIEQFKALLKINGILIISMPNRACWYRKIEKYIFRVTGKPTYYEHVHHILNEEEFSTRLKYYGFELQQISYYPYTTILSKILKIVGIREKNINTMFVGVYKLL